MKPHALSRVGAAFVLAGIALALPAGAQQIKRWVDERGMVHYGDALPAAGSASAVTDIAPAEPLSPADKAQAEQRLQGYRDYLAQPPAAPASAASAAAPMVHASAPLPQGHSCADQWARYNAAYACMDPYRMANGGIRPEAFTHCPQLTQPQCPAP